MKPPNPSDKLNSDREVSVAINNAVALAMRPSSGVIEERDMRRLRAYSEALVSPTLEHLEEGLLTPQELVFVHLANALRVQQFNVVKTERLPAGGASRELFRGGK